MHYIPLLFLCAKTFSFVYHRELALFLHNFKVILATRKNDEKTHVFIIDKTTIFFLIYLLVDFLFLLYCIWLIHTDIWEPGCMLLFLSALESYGVHGQIDGTYKISPLGFVYPRLWFKYLMSGLIMFILLQLLHGNI